MVFSELDYILSIKESNFIFSTIFLCLVALFNSVPGSAFCGAGTYPPGRKNKSLPNKKIIM